MSSTSVQPSLNLSVVATTIHDATISTIFGSTITIPTIVAGKWDTADPSDRNILTASCTQPVIAQIKDPNRGVVFVYPQIGCSPAYQDCCPYPFQANVLLKRCPQGYVSMQSGSYSACCPVVSSTTYSLYFMGVGQQTPCSAPISTSLVPEHMPPPETLTVQTAILARSLPLAPSQSQTWIAGPAVGSVIFLVALVAMVWFWCRRRGSLRKKQQPDQPSTTEDLPVGSYLSSISPQSPHTPHTPAPSLVPSALQRRIPDVHSPPQYCLSPTDYSPGVEQHHHYELPALQNHPIERAGTIDRARIIPRDIAKQ